MASICVGIRNDGTVDVDIAAKDDDEGEGWNFNNLQLDEAEFLKEELESVIARARARGFPKPAPDAVPSAAPNP